MKGIILGLLVLLTLAAPAAVQAQSGSGDGYNYSTNLGNTNTITITGYIGSGGNLTIPTNINGLTVTGIAENAFLYNNNLTSVTIPYCVTNIGAGAIGGCTSLATITVDTNNPAYSSAGGVLFDKSQTTLIQYPAGKVGTSYAILNSVTSIGDSAFINSDLLTSMTIPSSVTNIEGNAFVFCYNLKTVTISGHVTNIGDSAFWNCTSLATVAIPESVTTIGPGAFGICTSLAAITVDTNNPAYASVGGVLFDQNQSTILQYPAGKVGTSYAILNSVTNIAALSFAGCLNLISFTIPESVTGVGQDAFDDCYRLTSVTIAASVTSIGGWAFQYCTSLTNAYFTGNAPIADSTTFLADTNATAYYLPGTSNWGAMFGGIPAVMLGLANQVQFGYMPNAGDTNTITITNYTGPGGAVAIPTNINSRLVTAIGNGEDSVFGNIGVTSVSIPASVISIADHAFDSFTSLASVAIPASVTSIGNYAFRSVTSLTGIVIPVSVADIGSHAFDGCTGLTNINIPASVTSIGDYAFENCTNLINAYFTGNAPTADSTVFQSDTNAAVYYLPGTSGWGSMFGGIPALTLNSPRQAQFGYVTNADHTITITNYAGPGGAVIFPTNFNNLPVTGIGNGTNSVFGDIGVISITIPASVTTIGASAFSGGGMTEVTVPSNVTNIGLGAFADSNLTAITVSTNNPAYAGVGGVLFNLGATTLIQYPPGATGSYTIPSSVTSISEFAFADSGLTNVTIPSSVASIGEGAFNQCEQLLSVTIPNSVTDIGNSAFDFCLNLTNVLFGNGLTNLEANAFGYCLALTSIVLPASVRSIGDYAFESCTALTNIYIPGNAPSADIVQGDSDLTVYYQPGTSGWGAMLGPAIAVMLNPPNPSGSLQVTITPLQAAAVGAQWQVDGGVPQPSGATVFGLAVGAHTVSFDALGGWIPPSNQIVSVTPNGTAVAGGNYTYLGFIYTTNNGAATITGFIGSGMAAIPGTILGLPVSRIGDSAFSESYGLTSVTIPYGVTNIGDAAFADCFELTNITIPESVTCIGQAAFSNCFHLILTIPQNLTMIGSNAFYSCTLTNLTLGNGLTNIEPYAFAGCGLSTVAIPGSVTSIGDYGFAGNFLTTLTISDGVTSIGAGAFSSSSRLASVTIPNSVTSMGDNVFMGCGLLINAAIGSGVTNIGTNAFFNCYSLAAIEVDPNNAFYSSASGVLFDKNQKTLLQYPEGLVGSYTIPGSVTVIGDYAFSQCGLINVTIPNSVSSIGAGAFAGSGSSVLDAGLEPGLRGVCFQGNAPGAGSNVFSTDTNVTVYYLPGTTGWRATFAGAPTAIPLLASESGLILVTNGSGTIRHGAWPQSLVIGRKYTVKAVPNAGNLFANWVGGTNPPYAVLGSNASWTFTMQSNLLLEASFITNEFIPSAAGSYYGLFAPTDSGREQTNSGSCTFRVTTAGAFSGNLHLGLQSVPMAGKFGAGGDAQITSKRQGKTALTTTLHSVFDPEFGAQEIIGTVSDGGFLAQLIAYHNPYNRYNPAGPLQRYTLIIPGTNNPAFGPYGTSYGTFTVGVSGNITFAGSLADGTSISQSGALTASGYWPFYLPLYGGKGSLWAWVLFEPLDYGISSSASWIDTGHAGKMIDYRSGFTNQAAPLAGYLYVATNRPLLNLTSGEVMLAGGDLPFVMTNQIALTPSGKVTSTDTQDQNGLVLTINKTTGTISGSFANPSNQKQKIKVNGVLLQNETNAQGYFQGTNQSGALLLVPK